MMMAASLNDLISRQTSRPDIPGSMRSSRTMSGLCARAASRPVGPLPAVDTMNPSDSRAYWIDSASGASSSTTSTRKGRASSISEHYPAFVELDALAGHQVCRHLAEVNGLIAQPLQGPGHHEDPGGPFENRRVGPYRHRLLVHGCVETIHGFVQGGEQPRFIDILPDVNAKGRPHHLPHQVAHLPDHRTDTIHPGQTGVGLGDLGDVDAL